MDYWGHSHNGEGQGIPEPLKVHILAVARRAAEYARIFGAYDQAMMAALLHDLGKYTQQYQQRVRGCGQGRDHASIGALAALAYYKKRGIFPAMAIQGHHVGLGQYRDQSAIYSKALQGALAEDKDRYTTTDLNQVLQAFKDDGLTLESVKDGLIPNASWSAANHLDVRMLFSCLVDADFLETEAHFDGDAITPRRPRPEGLSLDIDRALDALGRHLARFGQPTSDIARQRRFLLDASIEAAGLSQGLFTLTAPTGFGKTLAMLAFALHHAKVHGLRRIILVMPYLNIIEQTAKIYRELFSVNDGFDPHAVLEHHSLVTEPKDEQGPGQDATDDGMQKPGKPSMQRLLSENWDAPIILTTNVQLLESMMAHKPSACRKLHRLAGSVIMFDEAQTLPPKLAKATLATLSRLADPKGPFKASVLFATATQPAFEALESQLQPLVASGWRPREINTRQQEMFAIASKRVKVRWRHDQPRTLEKWAGEMAKHRQMLAIVNLKRHAIELAKALSERGCEGVMHLSTNMCPAHRMKVLAEVRTRLDQGLPVKLVATQCIEAGVDISVPVVYRMFAPLESISQAAGRCNRHGELEKPGEFHVIQVDDDGKTPWPPGYGAGIGATKAWLNALSDGQHLNDREIINDPSCISSYYVSLYSGGQRDSSTLDDELPLLTAIREGDFGAVSKAYKLIDQPTVSILVPYCMSTYERLAEQARRGFDDAQARRDWRKEASHHAVSVYRPKIMNSLEAVQFHPREEVTTDTAEWFISINPEDYDMQLGLQLLEERWIA